MEVAFEHKIMFLNQISSKLSKKIEKFLKIIIVSAPTPPGGNMRYSITNEIIEEVKKAIGNKWGAKRAFSFRAGVHDTMLSALIRGKHRVVREDTWIRLCQLVPGLSNLSSPINESCSPIIVTSGSHSPATAVVNNVAPRPCADCRMKVLEAIMSADVPADAKVRIYEAVSAAIREDDDR